MLEFNPFYSRSPVLGHRWLNLPPLSAAFFQKRPFSSGSWGLLWHREITSFEFGRLQASGQSELHRGGSYVPRFSLTCQRAHPRKFQQCSVDLWTPLWNWSLFNKYLLRCWCHDLIVRIFFVIKRKCWDIFSSSSVHVNAHALVHHRLTWQAAGGGFH